VICAALQLARGNLIVCNVEYKQSLHMVNLDQPNPLKFIFDNIQQQTIESLDQTQTLQVMGHKTLAGFGSATHTASFSSIKEIREYYLNEMNLIAWALQTRDNLGDQRRKFCGSCGSSGHPRVKIMIVFSQQ